MNILVTDNRRKKSGNQIYVLVNDKYVPIANGAINEVIDAITVGHTNNGNHLFIAFCISLLLLYTNKYNINK